MTYPTRPQGLSDLATRRWRYGDSTGPATLDEPPVPGDLWLLLDSDEDFGEVEKALVLVLEASGTSPDHPHGSVLAIPVTPIETPGHAPGDGPTLLLNHSLLGTPLVLWPAMESRIGYTSLARRLGNTIEAFTLARLRAYMAGDAPAPFPEFDSTGHTDDARVSHADALAAAMWAPPVNRQ